jgi:V-type H+-transporting ATPase subunit C
MRLLQEELKKKQEARMPYVIVPDSPLDLDITDKENNSVYRLFVYANQSEDAIKALRRKGYTARVFTYDKNAWEAENKERNILKEQVTNLTVTLMRSATASFQQLFSALMHLKVMRAYIDGVLRFGIPPKFYIGIVIPKKGHERTILNDMTAVLAEKSLMEMYGEKVDANEAEDYWPFVCVNLTSPNFLHANQ